MTVEIQLLLLLAILIFVSKMAGHLSQRFLNQPVVFGEILAGLLFGPTLFNIFGWPVFASSAGELHVIVTMLAHIGVLLLMFVAGLETDLAQMRVVGKSACVTAMAGVLFPLGLGALAARLFGLPMIEALFIGVVLTATSVSISAQTLMEINQLRSKEGATIMGAAVVDDVLGIILLAFIVAFTLPHSADNHGGLLSLIGSQGGVRITLIVLCMTLFFAFAIWSGRRFFSKILEIADRLHASHAIPAAALLLILLFAVGAEYVGQVAAITGAYLVGIFLARTRFKHEIERGIHPFTYAFFVPIFFMSIGLSADARALGAGSWIFAGVIVLVAILSKILGCGFGARMTGCSGRESVRIGIGMISRGEVGLIVAQIGLDAGIIGTTYYAVMVVMVLATTVVTPILLRGSFPRVPEVQAEVYESVAGVERDDEAERA